MKRLLMITICVLMVIPVLAGCGFSIDLDGIPFTGPGTRYDVNDIKELDIAGAESIKIITVSDDVNIRSGGDRVLAELTGECRSTTKSVWLDARAEGDSIIIEVKYPIGITNCDTRLDVMIPEGFAGDFETGAISGDVRAQGLLFRLGEVYLHTISGNIDFDTDSCKRMKAGSTSGEITLSRLACHTDVSTISGEVTMSFDEFAGAAVGTVSGGVDANLPQEAAFAIDFGSVSGDFTSTHSGISVERSDGGFRADANGGGPLLKVNTTSGDFRLNGR